MVRKSASFPPEQLLPPEQRKTQRFTLLLRVGKLRTPDGEFLCVLRDVSDNGIKVRLFHAIPQDQVCEIELGSGTCFRVTRIWQKNNHAGFCFAEGPIAVDRLIAEAGPFPKRHIRLRLHPPVPILLLVEELTLPAQLCDLSQHGAALRLDQRLAIGCQVRIKGRHMPALRARVRWRRGGLHGLVFQEGFRLDALAELAERIQVDHDESPDQSEPTIIGPALTTD
jgi:hypothetical protein